MSKREDRINNIISILKSSNGSSVKDLANELNVSEMTIRRDLKTLEEKNIIDNFYGAAVFNPREDNPVNKSDEFSYSISINSHKMEYQKNCIGKKAAEFVCENDVVVIDTGTTTEKLTQNIDNELSFTALVFSANNLIHLLGKPNVEIIVSGGKFHRDTGMFEPSIDMELVKNTRTNKLFLSAAGVHEKLGITCAYSYEILLKKEVINNSLEVFLLVDSSKFGNVASAFICELDYIDNIITDRGISDEWVEIINKMGINLIIAD